MLRLYRPVSNIKKEVETDPTGKLPQGSKEQWQRGQMIFRGNLQGLRRTGYLDPDQIKKWEADGHYLADKRKTGDVVFESQFSREVVSPDGENLTQAFRVNTEYPPYKKKAAKGDEVEILLKHGLNPLTCGDGTRGCNAPLKVTSAEQKILHCDHCGTDHRLVQK